MTVYVVGCEGIQSVKIGWTTGPIEKRLKQLMIGSPYPLRLLWQSNPEHNAEKEQALHELFHAYRTHGEWFNFGNADPVALISAAIDLPPSPAARPLFSTPKPPQRPELNRPRPTVHRITQRDLLADLDEILGDDPVMAPELPPRLRSLAPEATDYSKLTGKALIAELAMLGVKVSSTGNRWPVNPRVIRDAISNRSTQVALIDPQVAS